MEDSKKVLQEGEIDLVEIIKILWSKKWFISKVIVLFMILGLIIAFTSPKEYEVSCTLIPEAVESNGKLGGSLGGLASLAGVDLGGLTQSSSTINPGLYRSVAQSTPFLMDLMNKKFYFDEVQNEMTIYAYYSDHYKSSLFSKMLSIPGYLIQMVKPASETIDSSQNMNDIIFLSDKQQGVVENLRKRILVTMDWELNIVTIEVKMQDPKVAAQMTEFTRQYITNYVTDYSISKSKEQLKFIEEQYNEREKEFVDIQIKLATFRDRNTNVNSARGRSEEERIQSEYNLAFNIYNQLAQQKESIKLQVNENTPVFTVLEPVMVPTGKSSPKRAIILIAFSFFGFLFSVAYIFITNLLKTLI